MMFRGPPRLARRWALVAITCTLVNLSGCSTRSTHSAPAPIFVVHLTVTGGYHFSGTLTASAHQSGGNFCEAQPLSQTYAADLNFDSIAREGAGNSSKDAFHVFLGNYSPQVRTYHDGVIFFVIHHHVYGDYNPKRSNPAYRIRVQLSPNHYSGTFEAHHLIPRYGAGPPVDARGSWRCNRLT